MNIHNKCANVKPFMDRLWTQPSLTPQKKKKKTQKREDATSEGEINSVSVLDTGTLPQGSDVRQHKTNEGSSRVRVHICVSQTGAAGGEVTAPRNSPR